MRAKRELTCARSPVITHIYEHTTTKKDEAAHRKTHLVFTTLAAVGAFNVHNHQVETLAATHPDTCR